MNVFQLARLIGDCGPNNQNMASANKITNKGPFSSGYFSNTSSTLANGHDEVFFVDEAVEDGVDEDAAAAAAAHVEFDDGAIPEAHLLVELAGTVLDLLLFPLSGKGERRRLPQSDTLAFCSCS
jgi:hypothetical protein